MSLTSHLNNQNSPITQYFKNHFKLQPFLDEENNGLAGAYTIRPKSFNDYPWSDMGHMTEYLLMLHMGVSVESLFPMRFARQEYASVFYEMKRKYDGFQSRFSQINFKELTDDLYKLSKIEAVCRSGEFIGFGYLRNLKATTIMSDDLKTIYELALSQHELFNNKKIKFNYNPIFDLSGNVGGADADLYIVRKEGNYLLDLKTTVKPVVKEDMLYQLLGYVFLDKNNKHNFVDIGLYLPRQNLISEWKVEDIIKNNSDFKTVEEAKNKFIETVKVLNTGNKPK